MEVNVVMMEVSLHRGDDIGVVIDQQYSWSRMRRRNPVALMSWFFESHSRCISHFEVMKMDSL
jgi:hypothetical protein